MKKLLLILIMFVSLAAFSQVRKATLLIPDSTTNFGIPIPANTLVLDQANRKLWQITAVEQPSYDLQSSAKILIAEGGASGNGCH